MATKFFLSTARQRSCRKVMFSQAFVCHRGYPVYLPHMYPIPTPSSYLPTPYLPSNYLLPTNPLPKNGPKRVVRILPECILVSANILPNNPSSGFATDYNHEIQTVVCKISSNKDVFQSASRTFIKGEEWIFRSVLDLGLTLMFLKRLTTKEITKHNLPPTLIICL